LTFSRNIGAGFEIRGGGQGNEFGEKRNAYLMVLRRGDCF
jgi:hypothetical protein